MLDPQKFNKFTVANTLSCINDFAIINKPSAINWENKVSETEFSARNYILLLVSYMKLIAN